MMTSGSTVKAKTRLRRGSAFGDQRIQPGIAAQQPPDQFADAFAAAELIVVVLEGAVEKERVERISVSRRHDVSAGDVGPGGRASAGEQRQQARMVGRDDRQLGNGREGVGACIGSDVGAFALGPASSLACSTRRSASVRNQ